MDRQTGNLGCLCGNQRMEIHRLQEIRLNQDRSDHIALDPHHRYLRVTYRAFPQHVYIALPLVGTQIVTEFLAHSLGAQPDQVLFVEMVIQQELDQLVLSAGNRITLIIGVLPEKHVEYHDGILVPMEKQTVRHGKFIEIRHHCRIVIILIRYIRLNFDLTHNFIILSSSCGYTFSRSLISETQGSHPSGNSAALPTPGYHPLPV